MSAIITALIGLFAIGLGHVAEAGSIDLAKAKTAYKEQCSKCHGFIEGEAGVSTGVNGIRIASNDMRFAVALPYGPPLRGIFGRTAGTIPDFTYSKAFQQTLQGVTWNHETLERWITDSQQWARGTRMYYRQPDPEVRRLIIAYLKAHSP